MRWMGWKKVGIDDKMSGFVPPRDSTGQYSLS